MKTLSFQASLLLATCTAIGLSVLTTSCGQDAAARKQATDTEARIVATVQQVLVQNPAQADAVQLVHTWYRSNEIPNIIKLDPHAAAVLSDHATLLKQVATTQPQLVHEPVLSTEQAQSIRSTYQKLVDESTANVRELTNLASSKTTMSEAEQRQFVAALATKESHQLQLTQYYGKRAQAVIAQRVQQKSHNEYMQKTWGLE